MSGTGCFRVARSVGGGPIMGVRSTDAPPPKWKPRPLPAGAFAFCGVRARSYSLGSQRAGRRPAPEPSGWFRMSEKVTFRSRHKNLRLIRRSAVEQILPSGQVVPREREVVYQFDNGVCRVHSGQDVLDDRFFNGEFSSQDAIEWLRWHPENVDNGGLRFYEERAPVPLADEALVEVAMFAAARDVDGLARLAEEEGATWKRKTVFEAISRALDAIEQSGKPDAQGEPVKPAEDED